MQRRAIVGAQTKQAIRERVVPTLDQGLEAQNVSCGLRHLGLVQLQKMPVQPKVGERGPVAGLGLRDFGIVSRYGFLSEFWLTMQRE
jgi:hypothetical protein